MKYLKTYSGVTSGTYLGREDGHPTTKHAIYKDFYRLVQGFGRQKDERYYQLSEMSVSDLQEETAQVLESNLKKEKGLEAAIIRRQISDLQRKLRRLNQ